MKKRNEKPGKGPECAKPGPVPSFGRGAGFIGCLVFPGRFRLKMILRFASSMTESSSEAR